MPILSLSLQTCQDYGVAMIGHDMVRVVQLHRDGMSLCVAARCADVPRETLTHRLKQGIKCDRMDNS